MSECDVTVIGEALIDVVVTDDGEKRHPGGSPLNVAVGLARLGVPVCLVADVGDDADGALIRDHLLASGVDLSRLCRTARTATSTATIGQSGAAEYDFDLSWTLASIPATPGRLLHTGSIAAVFAPGADRVADLLLGRPEGVLASFDPNVRPGLIHDRGDALARIKALIGTADIVKFSDEDARWLYPDERLQSVEERILAAGATLVALTLGAKGARLRTPAATLEIAASAKPIVDTIGAGDAFMSGLLFAVLAKGVPAPEVDSLEALRVIGEFASACAAITVSRCGADPPWAHELPGLREACPRGTRCAD